MWRHPTGLPPESGPFRIKFGMRGRFPPPTKKKGFDGVSSILNILGLTAAFAALYIILVQVHHDLTYNKALKDSDRIYVLTMPDRFSNNVYSTYVNRQMSEAVIAAVPSVEAGGCAADLGSNEVSVRLGEGQSPVELRVTSFSKPAIDVFGFELVAGNLDNWISNTDAVMSESAAKRLGLQVGDHFQYGSWNWTDVTVAAIYKDMPVNSDLSSIDFILNLGEAGMSDWTQWGWNYFIKLAEGADPKEFDEIAHQVAFDLFKTKFDIDESNLTEEKAADIEGYKKMMSPHLMKLTDNYFADNVGHQLLLRDGAVASAEYQHTQDIGQQPLPVGDVVGG